MIVTNKTTVMDIKRQLNETLKVEGIIPGELIVATFWNGKLTNKINDYILCKDIDPKCKILIYHVPKETKEDISVELNWFKGKANVQENVVNPDGTFVSNSHSQSNQVNPV